MKYPYLKTILLCLCLFASINAFAEAVEIDGIYYNLVTKIKEAEVTSNPNKYIGTVNIPETVSYNGVTYSVTSIEDWAFSRCPGLKKVVVPDIAAWCGIAFGNNLANPLYYAKHLYSDETTEITNLIIPNSVTTIGEYSQEIKDETNVEIIPISA